MSEYHLNRVRRVCLAFPEAFEQEAWGEPTFRVKEKLFAMYASAGNHHGGGRDAVWCKAPIGVQELMVRSEPEKYFVPPYVGPRGWVGVHLDALGDDELRSLMLQSYCMVAPKRLQTRVESPVPEVSA